MNDNTELAAQQAAGLRRFADMIEATPELAPILRTHLQYDALHVSTDALPVFAAFVRAAKAHGASIRKDYSSKFASVEASWGVYAFKLQAMRDEVCQRVVTGTETVTKTVKDPAAMAAVPEVEVTEEVEIVEWVCSPILAADTETAVAS